MSPILDLLREMRGRVAMYVGRDSISRLAMFLSGYQMALWKHNLAVGEPFMRGFQDWVQKRFNVTVSRSWDAIISFYSADEDEAMKRFWDLLDEYVTEKKLKEKTE